MVGVKTYGRMGNFLFQVACCIGYALKHNLEFTVPNYTNNPKWNPIYLQHLVNPNWHEGLSDVNLIEQQFTYKELSFQEEWRDKQILLDGYWQSEKYFKEYRKELLYLFNLPYNKKDGYISVHVRRGDYLELRDKHPDVTKEWYQMVMNKFVGYKFKFFSDDIAWCRQEFGDRQDCEFSTNSDEVSDLIEASCCEHNISSPSTFSWWINYLNQNENKKIHLPKFWFVDGYHLDTSDIVPDEWIRI
jgi:hypothetical protein